ncbi:MAG: hypothetical protein HYU52_01780 [Acidobacteria bacterium]|nr:hypothetical protein [Acidobacteriota bacterium]
MKHLLAVLAFLALAEIAAAESLTIPLRQSASFADPAATAVFTIDPGIADATIRDGLVIVTARALGSTLITIIRPDSTETIDVAVVQPPTAASYGFLQHRPASTGFYELGYESSSRRMAHTVASEDPERFSFRLTAVDQSRDEDERNEPVVIPDASIVLRRRGSELTLLDRAVAATPLSLDGDVVRGIHYESRTWLLSGGERESFRYGDLFLSAGGERVALASHRHRVLGFDLSENLMWSSDGERHLRGSVFGRFERNGLAIGAEASYDGEPGGALGIEYQDALNRLWIDARHKPPGFGSPSRSAGSFAEAVWNARPSARLSTNATTSAYRFRFPGVSQDNQNASVDARYSIAANWSIAGGASYSRFDDRGTESVDTFRVPLTIEYNRRSAGASLTARWEESSITGESGPGGRVSIHGAGRSIYASAWVDYESAAPSLYLILDRNPEFANALAELGIFPQSVGDISRLLRDYPGLVDAGLIENIVLETSLERTQAGFDLRWLIPASTRQSLTLRALVEHARRVGGGRDSALATLAYSRQLTSSGAELVADFTVRSYGTSRSSRNENAVAVRLRMPVSLRGITSSRNGAIEGRVVARASDGTLSGVEGATIRLDGTASTTTDTRGSYRFSGVVHDVHRIELVLPKNSYFRTPSALTAKPGEPADFEIAYFPARLFAHVLDDEGQPVSAATVTLRSSSDAVRFDTASDGSLSWVGAPGSYVVAIDSPPSGYSLLAGESERALALAPNEPASLTLRVRANRSVSGVVEDVTGPISVSIVELDRSVTTTDDGRFAFRNLPSGSFTIRATFRGSIREAMVSVPSAPTVISGIELK